MRQCSRILSNVDFFKLHVRHLKFEQDSDKGRPIELSYLLSKQPGARFNVDTILNCMLSASTKSIKVYLAHA